MNINRSELNLLIIWEHARYKEKEIINDLNQKLTIFNVYEVEWSKEYFSRNLTRFYGKKLSRGSHKEKHIGSGRFTLITFLDDNPNYSERVTSRGKEVVNINTFDAKSLYRRWTGGGHKIHGTNSVIETNHDLLLLFGMNVSDYLSNEVQGECINCLIKRDLIGHKGWDSVADFFRVLNGTIEYVVFRNFDHLMKQHFSGNSEPIELLVSNYDDIKYIANSVEIYSFFKKKLINKVRISGEIISFHFRYLGDEYYDKNWANNILKKRVLSDKGIYLPDVENKFYIMLYLELLDKNNPNINFLNALLEIADFSENFEITKENFDSRGEVKKFLDLFMKKNGYRYTKPDRLLIVISKKILMKILEFNRKIQKTIIKLVKS